MKFIPKLWKLEKKKDFWYQKAIDYFQNGKYDEAKDALEKNMTVNKANFDSLYFLGKIHFKLKNYEESLEFYHKSSEEYRKTQLRNTVKIGQMKNVCKFEEAVKYADLNHHPGKLNHEYWYNKGLTLFYLRKYDQASSCFEISLETNPNDPKLLYALAKCKLKEGNKPKYSEILNKVTLIEPNIEEKLVSDIDFAPIIKER